MAQQFFHRRRVSVIDKFIFGFSKEEYPLNGAKKDDAYDAGLSVLSDDAERVLYGIAE